MTNMKREIENETGSVLRRGVDTFMTLSMVQ